MSAGSREMKIPAPVLARVVVQHRSSVAIQRAPSDRVAACDRIVAPAAH